ncbi:Crp/Fnr family transcriptional regulator [Thermodesulfobacteriota bacterium]
MVEKVFRDILETLKLEICLSRATDSSLMELSQTARRLKFLKGEYVFNDGDASGYFYLVESGRVILSKDAPSGKAFTFLIATRGLPLNAVACFKPRPRFFSARAVEETMVIAIPSPAFKQWVSENADVAACILDTMGNLLDGAYTRILDLIDESAEQRILNALHMLSLRIGPDLPMTNNDIADMTGTSRETAARVISRLQEAGLIRKSRGHIEILNGLQLDGLSTSPIFIL